MFDRAAVAVVFPRRQNERQINQSGKKKVAKTLPDEPFHNFGGLKSVDQRILMLLKNVTPRILKLQNWGRGLVG